MLWKCRTCYFLDSQLEYRKPTFLENSLICVREKNSENDRNLSERWKIQDQREVFPQKKSGGRISEKESKNSVHHHVSIVIAECKSWIWMVGSIPTNSSSHCLVMETGRSTAGRYNKFWLNLGIGSSSLSLLNRWQLQERVERERVPSSSAFRDSKSTSLRRIPFCWSRTSSTTDATEKPRTATSAAIAEHHWSSKSRKFSAPNLRNDQLTTLSPSLLVKFSINGDLNNRSVYTRRERRCCGGDEEERLLWEEWNTTESHSPWPVLLFLLYCCCSASLSLLYTLCSLSLSLPFSTFRTCSPNLRSGPYCVFVSLSYHPFQLDEAHLRRISRRVQNARKIWRYPPGVIPDNAWVIMQSIKIY